MQSGGGADALDPTVDKNWLVTRNRNDVTPSYPKILAGLAAALVGDSGSFLVLDGEIVAVDRNGRPNFGLLQTRVNLGAPEARAAVSRVSVHYLLIDVLEQDNWSLRGESYDTRRRALKGVLAPARATAPTRSALC
jgi:bifunctional non-homologous end joining protein LigD